MGIMKDFQNKRESTKRYRRNGYYKYGKIKMKKVWCFILANEWSPLVFLLNAWAEKISYALSCVVIDSNRVCEFI